MALSQRLPPIYHKAFKISYKIESAELSPTDWACDAQLKGNCINFQLELILKYYIKERSLQSVGVQYSFVHEK